MDGAEAEVPRKMTSNKEDLSRRRLRSGAAAHCTSGTRYARAGRRAVAKEAAPATPAAAARSDGAIDAEVRARPSSQRAVTPIAAPKYARANGRLQRTSGAQVGCACTAATTSTPARRMARRAGSVGPGWPNTMAAEGRMTKAPNKATCAWANPEPRRARRISAPKTPQNPRERTRMPSHRSHGRSIIRTFAMEWSPGRCKCRAGLLRMSGRWPSGPGPPGSGPCSIG
jgi:hypothetical protein